MTWGVADEQPVPVRFTGTRGELGGMLLRGYLLMIPTIGLYRFWLTSRKRRFYWSNTEIGGDAFEYTGNATQLLLGFLMALAIFVPIYGLFFFLSTQSLEAAIVGYGAIAVLLWFLAGYAIYRARDFRLSRTLWRGIRLDQGGSAWGYAFRRFGWSLLMLPTLGLVYPFMAANLWSYRYRHSWFGDRQFAFTGSWKQLAARYYLCWVLGAVALAVALVVAADGIEAGSPTPGGVVVAGLAVAVIGVLILFYQSRELTTMFSSVQLGQARLTVRITIRGLMGQYLLFALALAGSLLALALGGLFVLGALAADAFANGSFDIETFMTHMRGSLATLVAIVLGYLLILAAFSLMSELFLGLGYWKLVANGASITGLGSLDTVRARAEDRSLAGEGLADALNVGAY